MLTYSRGGVIHMKPIGKACRELSIAAGRNSDCHFYQFIRNRNFASIRVCLLHVRHTRMGATVGSSNHSHVGGSSFHVSDCQIWAEIHYLDSPTDYREYLPVDSLQGWKPVEGQLIMLDDERPHSWSVLVPTSHIYLACLSETLALVLLLLLKH